MPNLTQSRRFVCLLTALLVATGAQAAKVARRSGPLPDVNQRPRPESPPHLDTEAL